MKLKQNYILVEVGGEHVAVAADGGEGNSRKIIRLNETGKLIWDCVEKGMGTASIIDMLLVQYDVDRPTAARSVERFVRQMMDAGIVEADG